MKNKKIYLAMFAIFFLIGILGSVAAERISYSNEDLNVTISDTILFGLIKTGDLGNFELKSHASVKEVRNVGKGKDRIVMWYEVHYKELEEDGLGDVKIINMRNGKEIERDYSFVIGIYENVSVNITEKIEELAIFKNGTKYIKYSEKILGTETKEKLVRWEKLKSRDIPKGKSVIGLMMDIEPDDYLDAVWTISGKEIDKHAEFISSHGETFVDNGGRTEPTGVTANFTDTFEITAIKKDSGSDATDCFIRTTYLGADLASGTFSGDWCNLTASFEVNNSFANYAFLVDTPSGSHTDRTKSGAPNPIYTNFMFFTGGWNHQGSFSTTELHGVESIAYTNGTSQAIEVIPLIPANATTLTDNEVNLSFNLNISDSLGAENLTIEVYYDNGTLAFTETNSSGFEGIYNFSNEFPEGNYSWNGTAWGNDSIAYSSETWEFYVDLIKPTTTLFSPEDELVIPENITSLVVNLTTGNYSSNTLTYYVWDSEGIFNETAISLIGNETNYSLEVDSFELGNYIWTAIVCYSNDFSSNCSLSSNGNYSFFVGGELLSVQYSNDTYETKEETFIFNVDLLEGNSVSLARLNYNGTNYVITNISSSGDVYTFTKNIFIPLNEDPSANQTNSFNLSFTYSGGTIQEFDLYEQVVQPISLTNCTSGTQYLNLSLLDEKTLELLESNSSLNNISLKINLEYYFDDISVNKTLNNSFSSNTLSLCFTPATENITLFGEIEYEDSTHVKRRYYFIRDTFSNTTEQIDLHNLLSTESTSFVVYLYDASSIALKDVYAKLEKKYTDLDDFKIVEMAKTDEFGIGILHFVSEDDVYKIEYYNEEGNLLYAPAEFHAVCLETICSITHTIPYEFALEPFTGLTGNSNFNYALSSNNSLISLTYNSLDGETYYDVHLEVDGLSIVNDSLRFCSETLTESLSGTLECNITNSTYGNHQLKVWLDGNLEISQYLSKENTDYQNYGKEGIFYTILIVLVLVLLFIWKWELSLIAAVVGIILSIALRFIPGTISTIGYLIVLVIYLIITGGER